MGKRIKSLRKIHGLTQLDLAAEIGLSRPNMANMEAGNQNFTLVHIERIAKALGMKPYQLMHGVWWKRQPNRTTRKE